MKISSTLRTLAAACTLAIASHAGAAVLQVNTSGILTGATGVDVGGTLYDVTFASGSCNSLFNGCVQSAFTFKTRSDGLLAAQALLDQVLVNGAAGLFDSDPGKVFGCANAQNRYCFSLIPTELDVISEGFRPRVSGGVVFNFAQIGSNSDLVESNGLYRDFDTRDLGYHNYALFELAAPTDIPEPTSIALFGLALAGLAFTRRRKA